MTKTFPKNTIDFCEETAIFANKTDIMSKEIYSIREEKRNGIPMNIVHTLTEDTLHINPYFVHVMPMEQMNDIYDDEEEKVHVEAFLYLLTR